MLFFFLRGASRQQAALWFDISVKQKALLRAIGVDLSGWGQDMWLLGIQMSFSLGWNLSSIVRTLAVSQPFLVAVWAWVQILATCLRHFGGPLKELSSGFISRWQGSNRIVCTYVGSKDLASYAASPSRWAGKGCHWTTVGCPPPYQCSNGCDHCFL